MEATGVNSLLMHMSDDKSEIVGSLIIVSLMGAVEMIDRFSSFSLF